LPGTSWGRGGLSSSAVVNWIKFGHAAEIAGRGFRLIMPDLRAHGASAKPHEPSAYPPDVLARDGLALIRHLGLQDYDLGGYSLGARTCVRMLLSGAAPRRLVLGGMGLQGLLDTGARARHFRRILENYGSFEPGSPEYMVQAFLRTTKGDPKALLLLLDSFVDSDPDELPTIKQETLVLAGAEDQDNGSAAELADLLPNGHLVEVPGGHMSVVTTAPFGRAIADFLAA
jgi:pimeloyl-ACP methyl ester carboxylesterase